MSRSFLVLLTGGLALATSVCAGSTLYSTSFESPAFTTGPIDGQNGWHNFSFGSSQVENTFAYSGSQAVEVGGAVTSQTGPFYSLVSTGPLVEMSAELAIFASSSQTEWQFAAMSPGFGAFLGGIAIDPNGNGIYLLTQGFPAPAAFQKATAFNSGAWHNVNFVFDIPTQTYSVSIDGVALGSDIPFCGDTGSCTSKVPITAFGLGMFDTFGKPGAGNDFAYIDNFSVSLVSSVPEPSTAGGLLLCLSCLAIILKSRKLLGRRS